MKFWNIFALLGSAMLLCDLAGTPTANAADTVDVANLDIAGVKLGMTPDEAIAALKSFDPTLEVTKGYMVGPLRFPGIGMSEVPEEQKSQSYFVSIFAQNQANKEQHVQDQFLAMRSSGAGGSFYATAKVPEVHGSPELVEIEFSPIPGQEKATAIHRRKLFIDDKPAPQPVIDGALSKYPRQISYTVPPTAYLRETDWIYDAKGQPLNSSVIKLKILSSSLMGNWPHRLEESGYRRLSLAVRIGNDGLVERMDIALFDESGMYRSIKQSSQTAEALTTAAKKLQMDGAAKSGSQTKF